MTASRSVKLKRIVEFQNAIMLGFEFKQITMMRSLLWQVTAPNHIRGEAGTSYVGAYKYRHQAVRAALEHAGLLVPRGRDAALPDAAAAKIPAGAITGRITNDRA